MSDKTEPPTQKKLRDARKKGQVIKSKEVSSAALLATVFFAVSAFMPTYIDEIHKMILVPTAFYEAEFEYSANAVMMAVVQSALLIFGPIVAMVAVVGVVANMAQVGMLFSAESLKPKLSNLNPASGLKKIFALKNLIEFIKSLFKIAFLSILIFLVIRSSIRELVKIPHCGFDCILPVASTLFFQIMIYTVATFIVLAAADYVFQRWQFMKDQKMSKDEVKKEYKESEGDPHIKGKRKQFAQELVQANQEAGVRRSKVVVTNPIHLAIALDYRQGETPLPIITAMGKNLQAKRIVQIAEEEGIPVMQNVPLAHSLFETGKANEYIPSDLIADVAEVLRWVMELERERNAE